VADGMMLDLPVELVRMGDEGVVVWLCDGGCEDAMIN